MRWNRGSIKESESSPCLLLFCVGVWAYGCVNRSSPILSHPHPPIRVLWFLCLFAAEGCAFSRLRGYAEGPFILIFLNPCLTSRCQLTKLLVVKETRERGSNPIRTSRMPGHLNRELIGLISTQWWDLAVVRPEEKHF
jgi:hypothetical protein